MTDATDHPTPADLQATPAIDADHPAVRAFAQAHASGQTARERAVSLAMAVRDQIRYDPYRLDLSPPGMRGSTCLQRLRQSDCHPLAVKRVGCDRSPIL